MNRWLKPTGVSAAAFLAALPEDSYDALVHADRQADILHLTPAAFKALGDSAK